MDIQATKIELAKLILNLENPSLIKRIMDMPPLEANDFGATLTEQEQFEIGLGLKQLDKGERIPFYEFMKNVS